MSDKEAVLRALARLPESIKWADVVDAVQPVVARDGSAMDVARLSAAILTPEELALYENPPTDGIPIRALLAELEAQPS